MIWKALITLCIFQIHWNTWLNKADKHCKFYNWWFSTGEIWHPGVVDFNMAVETKSITIRKQGQNRYKHVLEEITSSKLLKLGTYFTNSLFVPGDCLLDHLSNQQFTVATRYQNFDTSKAYRYFHRHCFRHMVKGLTMHN